jgi:hypothetical protein
VGRTGSRLGGWSRQLLCGQYVVHQSGDAVVSRTSPEKVERPRHVEGSIWSILVIDMLLLLLLLSTDTVTARPCDERTRAL